MSVRLYGNMQYVTSVEGDAAKAWMDGWVAAHASLIYTPPDLTSGHTLSVIDPPNPEGGCVAQLSYEYHFNLPETEWEFIQGEIERALWTDIATGACNSDSGSGTDV